MKLYTTTTSPYGRIVIVTAHELGLFDDIELVVAKTRVAGSAYYQINVSGRVPYLVLDDGSDFEDSQEICAYLDSIAPAATDRPPLAFTWPQPGNTNWRERQLHRRAESLIDGLCVWLRENYRPENERSATVIEHEKQRALRLLGWWEGHIEHPIMSTHFNLTQLILYCALDLDVRMGDFQWREDFPKLRAFMNRLADKPAIQAHTY